MSLVSVKIIANTIVHVIITRIVIALSLSMLQLPLSLPGSLSLSQTYRYYNVIVIFTLSISVIVIANIITNASVNTANNCNRPRCQRQSRCK